MSTDFSACLRRQWRYCLAMLACGTSFAIDWLEELHGNLLAAVDRLEVPAEDQL